jgi:erythromycin esterase-like protein
MPLACALLRYPIVGAAVIAAAGCHSPSQPFASSDGGVTDGGGEVDVGEFVRREAIPLSSLDLLASFDDLEPLRPLLVERPVVLLGEADHGVAELKEAKLRLIAFLYLELGRSVLADEVGRAEANLVNRFIETGEESFVESLDIFGYASYSRVEEQVAFYMSLRRLSEERPEGQAPLRYQGFDLDHGLLNARDEVMAYLTESASSTVTDSLSPLVGCVDTTPQCEQSLDRALSLLQEAEPELVASSSQGGYDEAEEVLRGLAETVHFYLMVIDGSSEAEQFRENVMIRRADEYIAAAPSGIIFSAHSLHVARARSSISPLVSLGEHLSSDDSDATYVLSATYYEGTHLERDQSWSFSSTEVAVPSPGSLEDILHRARLPLYVLPFQGASQSDPASSWVYSPRRCVAAGFQDIVLSPAYQWDGVIYIDRVRATTPLVGE